MKTFKYVRQIIFAQILFCFFQPVFAFDNQDRADVIRSVQIAESFKKFFPFETKRITRAAHTIKASCQRAHANQVAFNRFIESVELKNKSKTNFSMLALNADQTRLVRSLSDAKLNITNFIGLETDYLHHYLPSQQTMNPYLYPIGVFLNKPQQIRQNIFEYVSEIKTFVKNGRYANCVASIERLITAGAQLENKNKTSN